MASFPLPLSAAHGIVHSLAAAGGALRRRGGAVSRIGAVEQRPAEDPDSDEALMLANLGGDAAAFGRLVERYRVELHRFLARFLGSASAADDVFQEAFLQVHQSARTFDLARRFKPWLFTIAANKARDWHRRAKRRSGLSLDAPLGVEGRQPTLGDTLAGTEEPPAAPAFRTEEAARVKAVVDSLPPHFREILLLSYFQRLSYNQIADGLQIPLGTVKSRLHAAVAAFGERWRELEPGDSGASGASSSEPGHA